MGQAQPKAVENVLKDAYAIDSAVDEELVNYILKPGLEVRCPTQINYFWLNPIHPIR